MPTLDVPKNDIQERLERLDTYLKTKLLPFWIENSVDEEYGGWRDLICRRWDRSLADAVQRAARELLDSLISQLPYIGGDDNHLTGSLIDSARCLAFLRSMEQAGRSAEEAGKVLYDAAASRIGSETASMPADEWLSRADLTKRRRARDTGITPQGAV